MKRVTIRFHLPHPVLRLREEVREHSFPEHRLDAEIGRKLDAFAAEGNRDVWWEDVTEERQL